MDYLASLMQRGLISPDALQSVSYLYSNRPGMPQIVGPEMAPRGGARNYMNSGKKVIAPDYANSNEYGMVNRSGRRIDTDPDHDHLIDSLKSYNGDMQATIDGYRDSYANNPRPERLDDIKTLESWKQQGFKLNTPGSN